MRPFYALVRCRVSLLRNVIVDFRRDSVAKVAVIACGLVLVVAIGYLVALHSFRFIEAIPPIGVQLNSRLLGLLFLVLFTMVALSNAIVSYTSLFIAGETRFFFENPLPPVLIFATKVLESIVFSGWATLVLCYPILAAFGVVRNAPASYYVESAAILLLFILFCGVAGAGVSTILLSLVRRWTPRRITVVASGLTLLIGWGFLRSFDFGSLNGEENILALSRFTMSLSALQSSFFPSTWATSGILAAVTGEHREVLFNAGLLIANTAIFAPLLSWYADSIYSRRWMVTSEGAAGTGRADGRRVERRASFEDPDPIGSLVRKDLLTFARDPAQLSQFVLFLLLTVVYVLSLVQIPSTLFSAKWRIILYFSNIAAISLILSSFTSRFLFPLISLEGKAFWIVGLAPVPRALLVDQKVRFGRLLIVGLGGVAGVCSCLCLGYHFEQTISAVFTITLAAWILTALAVGFGAAFPNMNEDNPARIAVGFGGTLNFFASAIAVIILIAIQTTPYFVSGIDPSPTARLAAHAGALAFAAAVSATALRTGRRSLSSMEF